MNVSQLTDREYNVYILNEYKKLCSSYETSLARGGLLFFVEITLSRILGFVPTNSNEQKT